MSEEKFDPIREFTSIRDSLSRAVEQSVKSMTGTGTYPPIDVYETADSVVARIGPLSGISAEKLEVSMEKGLLTISLETEADTDLPEDAAYIVRERLFGAFTRSVRIATPVKAQEARAKLSKGLLTITLPKVSDERPQIIDVTPSDE